MPCKHKNNEIHICEYCDHKYCEKCMNESCDWCEHRRFEQTMCPECDSTCDIFDQVVCIGCLYHDITDGYDGNVIYCETCEKYYSDYYDDCTNNKHEIIKDKKILIQKIMNEYPQAEKFFKLFYNNPLDF